MTRTHAPALARSSASAARMALAAVAAAAALGAAPAAFADGARTANNPFGPVSGELPDALRDRGGIEQGSTSSSRKPLFTLQTMTFSLYDKGASSNFVRLLPDGVREADVKVVDPAKSFDKLFLFRTQCEQRTFYFGPTPKDDAAPALKPIEAGSVGELLHKSICAK